MSDLLEGLGSIEHKFIGSDETPGETEVYLKRSVMKPGAHLVQHCHNYDHAGMLVSGAVLVRGNDSIWHHYMGRATVLLPAGINHEIMAGPDGAVWYCVHATSENDETKVDHALISPHCPLAVQL